MLNRMVSSDFKNNEVIFPREHGVHCSHPIISSMNNDVIDLLGFPIMSTSILIKTTNIFTKFSFNSRFGGRTRVSKNATARNGTQHHATTVNSW